jgi:hypothetical protein
MKDGKITTVDEFPYNNNYDIFFDNNDNAWILSSYGVFVVKEQDMLDNKKAFDYQVYDMSSGLLSVPTGNSTVRLMRMAPFISPGEAASAV